MFTDRRAEVSSQGLDCEARHVPTCFLSSTDFDTGGDHEIAKQHVRQAGSQKADHSTGNGPQIKTGPEKGRKEEIVEKRSCRSQAF